MRSSVKEKIEAHLSEKLTTTQSVGGGCIAQSQLIATESGRQYFLKSSVAKPRIFQNEANGLRELAAVNCIRVPKVIAYDEDFLLLEYIEQGNRAGSFFTEFGSQLAKLHQSCGSQYGFYEDNYIGLSPQLNIPSEEEKNNWVLFYFNKRLKYQYDLAVKNGYDSSKLRKGFQLLEDRMDTILAGCEKTDASLLHGDLWGGNYLCDENNNPVLIDPAVYYGHREAELAMTKLFGGFNSEFYDAYDEAYPLQDGYHYRENIYLLYHVLNHLNIFGRSYYAQAVQLIWSYV